MDQARDMADAASAQEECTAQVRDYIQQHSSSSSTAAAVMACHLWQLSISHWRCLLATMCTVTVLLLPPPLLLLLLDAA
jgi:hypothetical protein